MCGECKSQCSLNILRLSEVMFQIQRFVPRDCLNYVGNISLKIIYYDLTTLNSDRKEIVFSESGQERYFFKEGLGQGSVLGDDPVIRKLYYTE